ncbi:hypothetical protein Tco_0438813 [Tanacetum coccineum]
MGRRRMIWSKAAREKLEEELDLYLDASLVIVKFERPNDVVRVAWDNITAVMKDLQDIISSKSSVDKQQQPHKDDVSLIINDCRSKVENQLQYICDNDVSHNNDKAFQDFVVHFKSKIQQQVQEAHLNDNDTTASISLTAIESLTTNPVILKLNDFFDYLYYNLLISFLFPEDSVVSLLPNIINHNTKHKSSDNTPNVVVIRQSL